MPGCEEYSALISASLDGELTQAEEEKLSAHLHTCKDCSAYLSLMQAVSSQLRETQDRPPEKLKKGILYQVELEASRKRFRFGAYGRWTAIAAAICLLTLGIVKLAPLGGMKAESGAAYLSADAVPRAPTAVESTAAVTTAGSAPSAGADVMEEDVIGGLMMSAPVPAPDMAVNPAGEPSADLDETNELPFEGTDAGSGILESQKQNAQYRVEELPGYTVYQSLPDNASYYSVCILYDALPDTVNADNGCTQLEAPEGQQRWAVPLETILALELAEDFDEIYYRDLMADQGLVVVLTQEE